MTFPASPRRSFFDYRDAEWQTGVFRTLAIAILSTGFATGPVALIGAFGGPRVVYLLPLVFFVGLAAVLSTETLARPDRRSQRGAAVRFGELVVVLVIARLAVWFHSGFPTPAEVALWLIDPGGFFAGEFVAALSVLCAGWVCALLAARDFFDLRIQADEAAARDSKTWGDSASQWRVFQPVSRTEVLGRFASRWLALGMFLVFCAATTRVAVTEQAKLLKFALRDAGLPVYVLVGVIAYFVTGLLLMSDGRLAVLRGRWYNQGVRIAPHLRRRWHIITVSALLGVALLALLLPLGPTGWLASIIEWVLALLWRVLLWLMMLFQSIFLLLMLLLRGTGPTDPGQPPERVPLPQAVPNQRQALMQLPEWLGGAVLWAIIVLLAGYLLIRYFTAGGFAATPLGRQLLKLRLWSRARGARLRTRWGARVARVRARWARRVGRREEARGVIEAKPATPREEVRAYYLKALREAASRGVARPPNATPLEYARDLGGTWPEAGEDVEALTDAFVEARYSQDEIDEERASSAETLWRRLARAFSRKPDRPARG